jgi:cytochrome c553
MAVRVRFLAACLAATCSLAAASTALAQGTQDAYERAIHVCASCLGEGGRATQAVYPRLAGQHADYVYRQLKIFGIKLRPHGTLMKNETNSMTSAEMRAVAAYVQSLGV